MHKCHVLRYMHLEPCRLVQLALHAVCYSVFPVIMRAGLPNMGMSARAHSAMPAPSPALLRHRCALLSASWITVSTLFDGSNKVFFSGE